MLMKRPKHRVFDYPSRFYKPEEDPEERRKRKLGFSQMRRYNRKKGSPILWLLFIAIIIIIIIRFSGKG